MSMERDVSQPREHQLDPSLTAPIIVDMTKVIRDKLTNHKKIFWKKVYR